MERGRDAYTVDRFGGMSSKPTEHMTAHARLGADIPQRLDLAGGAGDRMKRAGVGIRFDEAQNAMFVGTLAGSDGVPQHGRKDRPQGCDIAHHAVIDQAFERGHVSLVEQRVDDLPVGSIPTDEENFLGKARRHRV